jgi:hypothetical protein
MTLAALVIAAGTVYGGAWLWQQSEGPAGAKIISTAQMDAGERLDAACQAAQRLEADLPQYDAGKSDDIMDGVALATDTSDARKLACGY